jgi:hypothetical protein
MEKRYNSKWRIIRLELIVVCYVRVYAIDFYVLSKLMVLWNVFIKKS